MSKYADAAYEWMSRHARSTEITTSDLWAGLLKAYPELVTARDGKKTPRGTVMRDLRLDRKRRFIVGKGRVALSETQ